MPISERIIKHSFGYGPENITSESNLEDETNIVHKQTFRSLVGCIGQLSELVVQSNEIFCELVLLTSTTNARLGSLTKRVSTLSTTIEQLPNSRPSYDIAFEESTVHRQYFQVPQTQQLSSKESVSFSMQTAHDSDSIRKMPPFHILNAYKDCLMGGSKISSISDRYSHPKYFFNQWCLVQEARMKKVEHEKQQQRADKKARKAKQYTATATEDMRKSKKKESISWQDRYMVNGEAVNRASISAPKRSSLGSDKDVNNGNSNNNSRNSNRTTDSTNTERDEHHKHKSGPPPAGRKSVSFEPTTPESEAETESALGTISEGVRDSDDDSDFDDEIDYRADPKYNLKKPLVIDISGNDRSVFVSKEPFQRMRVVSNATLHYSAVYQQKVVSARVVGDITSPKKLPTAYTDEDENNSVKLEPVKKPATPVTAPVKPPKNPTPPTSITLPAPPVQGTQTASVPSVPEAPTESPAPAVSVAQPKPPSPPVETSPRPKPPPPRISPPNTQSSSTPSPPTTPSSGTDSPPPAQTTTETTPTPASRLFTPASQESMSAKSQQSLDGDEDDQEIPSNGNASTPPSSKPPPPPPPKSHYLDEESGSSDVVMPITQMVAPPPRPSVPPPPPPKNPRLLVKSVRLSARLGAGLLASINSRGEDGSALSPAKPKPAAPEPVVQAAPVSRPPVPSFMDAIRSGSTQLKKVDMVEQEKEKARRKSSMGGFGDASVAAILERRKFLEAEASDSDSDEDDWN